ncbi:peritrophin-1-like [Anastrepha ludens]|uniref:peritrophin-1-like n=1 Tax=Anastrepha ludens TaxID=28586 RepID=UPI0023AF05E3|nr:peritrophin-1-like [Anastrepha ludens]
MTMTRSKTANLQILTVIGLWIWTAVASKEMLEQPFRHPDCPLIDDPMHPIQLPYPTDCRKYYSCKNGYAYSMLCQNELQWSTLTYRCDFPTVAKCAGTPSYPIDPTASGAFPTSENNVFKRDATDCNKFYSCMPMRCPPLQYWNVLLERCDSPQNTLCETTAHIWTEPPFIYDTIPTAATPPSYAKGNLVPAPMNPIHEAESSNLLALCSTPGVDYVRHPYDCHKFIQCDGFATVHTCANDLYWNSEVMACDRYCK